MSLNGLGYMYFHGLGVEKDVARAWQYLDKARNEDKDNQSNDVLFNLGLVRRRDGAGGSGACSEVVASALRLTLAVPRPAVEHDDRVF